MTVQNDESLSPEVADAEPVARRSGSDLALLALGLAALIAVLDGTVVAVALGSLADSVHAPLPTIVWVTVGYLLAAAAMLPLLGWATARFGGRRVFLLGLALFVLGSGLATLAWSAQSLIAFRVVQGFGGGLLEPSSLALAAGLASKENVGRVLGRMSTIINVAPVLGPIFGGLLLETGHWQWIFIVNLPLGLGVLIAALLFIPADPPSDPDAVKPRADVRGLLLLTVGFVSVLFALNKAGGRSPWWMVAVPAILGALLLGGYVRHALVSLVPPALDLRLFRRQGFAATLVVMGLVGLTMYSQLTSLPIFLGRRFHYVGLAQGLLVCALGVGLLVSMPRGGRISDRTGARPLVRAGSLGTALGLAVFALFHDRLPLAVLLLLFVLIGLSFGFTASPTFAGMFRILRQAEHPQGTTALFMTVQLAASLGVTVLGLLQARSGAHWVSVLFTILAVGMLATTALSAGLPGRPMDSPGGVPGHGK